MLYVCKGVGEIPKKPESERHLKLKAVLELVP